MSVALSSPHGLINYLLRPLNPFSTTKLPLLRLLASRPFSCSFMAAPAAGSPAHAPVVAAAATIPVKERIELTDTEQKIFTRLLNVVGHFALDTQLRVAGGWVRDKLLGGECNDIDIALDNMFGKEFCDKVEEYMKSVGEVPKGRGDIKSNPDQSKHLETARMRIFDTWIDFVNLRSETYADNSRIPTMTFGTAEEDAYRRDLTINSMFYNIKTDSVEDFTGRGLSDLKFGRIVTPLPPKATFLDDPLRVLRAIRFGARFEFSLDQELKEAARDEEVKTALADKISRERIGHEVDLMMSGNQPVKAMTCICELGLFSSVFALPDHVDPVMAENYDRLCVEWMAAATSLLERFESSPVDDGQRRLYLYAALFLPLRKSVYIDLKRKKIPVTNFIFQNSLKLKNSDAESVVSLHNASEKFISLIPLLDGREELEIAGIEMEEEFRLLQLNDKNRISAGLLLCKIKDFWRAALLLSTLLEVNVSHLEGPGERVNSLDRSKDLFTRTEKCIIDLGLESVWDMKPLVGGGDIMAILQRQIGGPEINHWKQKAFKWQLGHRHGKAEQCLDWVKESISKRPKLA